MLYVYIWFPHCFFPGPPSAPRNVAFNINETALILEWSPPSDTGGRKDLTYSVICKKCGLDNSQCEDCGGGLRFIPRHTGLINNSVIVLDFVSHVNYTFEIEAMNGVSELSISPKPFTAITVTTDQDGKSLCWYLKLSSSCFFFSSCPCQACIQFSCHVHVTHYIAFHDEKKSFVIS